MTSGSALCASRVHRFRVRFRCRDDPKTISGPVSGPGDSSRTESAPILAATLVAEAHENLLMAGL